MKDGMDNMNIELLTSGQAEAVSLSEYKAVGGKREGISWIIKLQ